MKKQKNEINLYPVFYWISTDHATIILIITINNNIYKHFVMRHYLVVTHDENQKGGRHPLGWLGYFQKKQMQLCNQGEKF